MKGFIVKFKSNLLSLLCRKPKLKPIRYVVSRAKNDHLYLRIEFPSNGKCFFVSQTVAISSLVRRIIDDLRSGKARVDIEEIKKTSKAKQRRYLVIRYPSIIGGDRWCVLWSETYAGRWSARRALKRAAETDWANGELVLEYEPESWDRWLK